MRCTRAGEEELRCVYILCWLLHYFVNGVLCFRAWVLGARLSFSFAFVRSWALFRLLYIRGSCAFRDMVSLVVALLPAFSCGAACLLVVVVVMIHAQKVFGVWQLFDAKTPSRRDAKLKLNMTRWKPKYIQWVDIVFSSIFCFNHKFQIPTTFERITKKKSFRENSGKLHAAECVTQISHGVRSVVLVRISVKGWLTDSAESRNVIYRIFEAVVEHRVQKCSRNVNAEKCRCARRTRCAVVADECLEGTFVFVFDL